MMSSTAPSNDNDVNNNVGSTSLSVVQTVKKWFQSSWPLFGGSKIDESERNNASTRSSEEEATTNEEEAAVVYLHQDECASVDEHTAVVCGHYEENEGAKRGDGLPAYAYSSNEAASSSALSNEQLGNNNNYGPGSRVMDLVKAASPKKYFLRNRRRRKSWCRFHLDADVVASTSTITSSQVNNNNISSTAARSSDELHPNAAPTLPQDTTTSTITTHQHWTQTEVTSLRNAYQQSNPTSTTLWHDIATIMGGERTASECQRKWFSLVATPKKRVAAVRSRRNGGGGSRVNTAASQVNKIEGEDGNEEDDDLFDSTPLKYAVQEIENDISFQQRRFTTATAATTATKQQPLEQDHGDVFHSPNKKMTKMIKSPLPKRPRMFSPKAKQNGSSNNGGKNDTVLSPLLNRRKGYNTYVNNLRREMNRAQKAKKKKGDVTTMSGRCGIGNKSSNTIRIKEGKGKSQLSAELLVDGTFVLNPSQEDGNEDHDCDIDDVFEGVFRMEDEENEFL